MPPRRRRDGAHFGDRRRRTAGVDAAYDVAPAVIKAAKRRVLELMQLSGFGCEPGDSEPSDSE